MNTDKGLLSGNHLINLIPKPQFLTWSVVVFSVIMCASISGLHLHQKHILEHLTDLLENMRLARIDMAEGFMHVSLGNDPSAPFDQSTGYALLRQAMASFEETQAKLNSTFAEPANQFKNSLSIFHQRLKAWHENTEPEAARQTELRIAYHDVELHARHLDESVRNQLGQLSKRYDTEFIWMLGISILLLTGICTVVFFMRHARQISEAALDESRQLLNFAVEAGHVGLWDWDPLSGQVVYSPEWKRQIGYEDHEISNRYEEWESRVHPDDLQHCLNTIHEFNQGTSPGFNLEFRIKHKDGSYRRIFSHASALRGPDDKLIRLVGSHIDITELRQAEETLRQQELLLLEAGEIAHIGGWEFDPVTYKGQWTEETARIHEADPDIEPTAQLGMSCYHGASRTRIETAVKEAIDTGKPYDLELEITTFKGNHKWIRTICHPILENGKAVRIRGSIQDITQRKQTEKEKEQLQDQLLQAHKMEAVGRLAGGVAHDFNNMLQTILGYAELALRDSKGMNLLQENIQEIKKAGLRSADLTRQLLAFARRQTVSPKVLDLNDTVTGMLKMLQRLIGEDIDLAWIPGGSLWSIHMDPSQIDQILANLAVNARDAIQGVGKLTIETGNVTFDQNYCNDHLDSVPGDYVHLAVSDDGRGMDRETVQHIFEPFYTTKGIGEGTGLGLATVYGIVQQNNGFINVYSEPGEGTTFRIYLPRHNPGAPETSEHITKEITPRGCETVLIVEDEEAVLLLAKKFLDDLGYTVLVARTPFQAIDLASHYLNEIHLLVTDVVMPEMNGKELSQKLCAVRPTLKTIFMSGYTANVIAHRGVLDEGLLFVQKPFSSHALGTTARLALDG